MLTVHSGVTNPLGDHIHFFKFARSVKCALLGAPNLCRALFFSILLNDRTNDEQKAQSFSLENGAILQNPYGSPLIKNLKNQNREFQTAGQCTNKLMWSDKG
jgi:hypothetical protein